MENNENRDFQNDELYVGETVDNEVGSGEETEKETVFDLSSFSSKSIQTETQDPKGKKKKNKKRTTKETVLKLLLSVFLIGTITVCLVVGGFMIYIFGFVDYSMVGDLEDLTLNFTTTIYCKDNKTGEFVEYQRIHGGDNRIWISDAEGEIPQDLKDALVAIEDKDFRDHDGVDWGRTVGAFANEFLNFSSKFGGSTITQQLVKNLTDDRSQKASRKIREILRAHYLESKNSKDDILECYINTVAMANGMYGAEVASNYYFDKSAKDLTLAECACLAAIVNLPEYYRPDQNPINNKERRQLVLSEMYSQGYITKEEYESAKQEDIKIVANTESLKEAEVYSYFVDAVIDQVVDGLVEKYGYDVAYAETLFFNGGYKIYSTLNLEAQEIVETVMKYDKYKLKNGKQTLQGAITVMDYQGHVIAIGGGFGTKTENRGFNYATQAIRQPGSTMKPIAAYAPAIENNLITYSSFVKDVKKTYGDGWYPNNYDRRYWGTITARYALEQSRNTVPTYLVESMGLQTSYDFLTKELGITTLTAEDMNYSSLGMGGTYNGISTMESAAAYAVFGNGGNYYKPTTYYEVRNQDDELILSSQSAPDPAISEDTATVMNHMLQNVVYNGGTGSAARSFIPHMKIYAKTGTADQVNDVWFAGGSPYYVATAWCGFDQLAQVPVSSIARTLWGDVMSKIHKNLPAKSFTDSEYATRRYYCTATGLVATSNCPSKAVGWYKTSYMPTCTTHKGKLLDEVKYTQSTSSSKPTSSATSSAASSSSASSATSSPQSSQVTSSSTSENTSTQTSSENE